MIAPETALSWAGRAHRELRGGFPRFLESCEGGILEGGCQAPALCDGLCNASVAARAVCVVPRVFARGAAGANPTVASAWRNAMETHLGQLLLEHRRLQGMTDAADALGAAGSLTDIKPACIPPVTKAASTALADVKSTLEAAASVIAAL